VSLVYKPTDEQAAIIECNHNAFISACPGAGKTRTLVERARRLIRNVPKRQGIAFLSFTNAAVTELQEGLQREGILPSPAMPHFIGTFDSFIWHFFVSPLGIPGVAAPPRLVQDKNDWLVRPYSGAQTLKLRCFDRSTGVIDSRLAAREGFDVSQKGGAVQSYVSAAKSTLSRALKRGEVDFTDARTIVKQWPMMQRWPRG
jgi:DNA helicase-2/ATP-dependent DNA helicase PcrA